MSSRSLFDSICRRRRNGFARNWGELPAAAGAWATVELARRRQRPILMLCPSDSAAQRRQRELRFFADDDLEIVLFPDRQTLPYDSFSPAPGLLAARLAALHRIGLMSRGVVVCCVSAAMHRLPPKQWLDKRCLLLKRGQALDTGAFAAHLQRSGYDRVEEVRVRGEYALRGGVVDLHPAMLTKPIRLELLDTEIESIRAFDPSTQRGGEAIDSIEVLPAREFDLDKESRRRFSDAWHDYFDVWRQPSYERLSAGEAIGGAEYYLPLFFDRTQTLFEYLDDETLIMDDGGEMSAVARVFEAEIHARRDDCEKRAALPPLPPATLFIKAETLRERVVENVLSMHAETVEDGLNFGARPAPEPPALGDDAAWRSLLDSDALLGHRALYCAPDAESTPSDWRAVANWNAFFESDIQRARLSSSLLSRGALFPEHDAQSACALLCPHGVERQRVASTDIRDRRRADIQAPLSQLGELAPGDLVVHEDYGIGRYCGLQSLHNEDDGVEFLVLEYADGDQIHIRMEELHKLSLFNLAPRSSDIDDKKHLQLDALGAGARRWRRRVRSAEAGARDMAMHLMRTEAARVLNKSQALPTPAEYQRFADEFPFDETPDQALAIEETLADMRAARPMDRLICGDVGLGKTEVAMRAAFVAGLNGMQTVILTPTTLLADQHLESFRRRFQNWPLRIERISRLNSGAEYHQLKSDVRAGQVDILIGTHRLLRSEIGYGNLGLLVIDEEHRFGLRDKERFKEIRAGINLLSMSATPIPRTLNMALGKLRDLSLIVTPPQSRVPIRTTWAPYADDLVREAISRELHREGQVFHQKNRIDDLRECARRIAAWFPQTSIGVVHGRMAGSEMKRVMENFRRHRHDILVCTTIIESGLDVPNANTIVIEDADKLGLAELHQLRGRVGRSDRQAYAWLLTPPRETLNSDAKRRLQSVIAASELGAGYQLASADLDIRGGGELLGKRQSGHLEKVGLGLYSKMLGQAVTTLRDEPESQPMFCEVDLERSALIPESWIPDAGLRLRLYQRISAADGDELGALAEEIRDRFGRPPQAVLELLDNAHFRLRAMSMDIRHLKFNARGGELQFNAQPSTERKRCLLENMQPAWRQVDACTFRLSAVVPSAAGRALLAGLLLSSLEEASTATPRR